jgi:hypothetical protein
VNAAVPRERLVPVVEIYVRECGLPGRRGRDPSHLRRRVDKVRQGRQPRFTRGFTDRLLTEMGLPHLYEDVAA